MPGLNHYLQMHSVVWKDPLVVGVYQAGRIGEQALAAVAVVGAVPVAEAGWEALLPDHDHDLQILQRHLGHSYRLLILAEYSRHLRFFGRPTSPDWGCFRPAGGVMAVVVGLGLAILN